MIRYLYCFLIHQCHQAAVVWQFSGPHCSAECFNPWLRVYEEPAIGEELTTMTPTDLKYKTRLVLKCLSSYRSFLFVTKNLSTKVLSVDSWSSKIWTNLGLVINYCRSGLNNDPTCSSSIIGKTTGPDCERCSFASDTWWKWDSAGDGWAQSDCRLNTVDSHIASFSIKARHPKPSSWVGFHVLLGSKLQIHFSPRFCPSFSLVTDTEWAHCFHSLNTLNLDSILDIEQAFSYTNYSSSSQ